MIDKMLYWFSRPMIGLYGRMLKLDVLRHARLPKGPKIIAANHPSTSDPFLVALITREPARMLVASHAFDVPVFGGYLRASRHIPVAPSAGRQAFETARQHLDSGGTLIIFPEGNLSPREGGFHEPKTGVARLALMTGAPIIPVGISLFPKGLWYLESGIHDEWVTSRWALRGPYGLTVGEQLHFKGSVEDRAHVTLVTARVMQHIADLVAESRDRIDPMRNILPAPLGPYTPVSTSS